MGLVPGALWGFSVNLQTSGWQAIFSPLITNVWAHLVVTYKQGQYEQLWANGALVQSNSLPNESLLQIPGAPLNSAIGIYDYPPGPYQGFIGAIDDVRIYNRALSPSDIQALYQLESAPPNYPSITQQPQNLTLTNGDTASFTVTALGTAPLSYGWQKNGVNLSDGGNISGSARSVLTLTSTTLGDTGYYAVVVTNAYGSVTSAVATLTVLAAPSILVPPQNLATPAGSNALFTVGVAAYSPVNYQWVLNGTNIPGATGASLLLTNVQLNQSGSYSVAVSNSLGYALSAPGTLTVLAPPQILSQPRGQIGYWGTDVSFSVSATGSTPLSYQWYFDGFPISWATNATLDLTDLDLNAGGQYSVEVTNLYDSATSQAANLTVNPAAVSPGLYFGLTISGAVGETFGIQYVTNVNSTSWTVITNITLIQPVQLWVDTNVNASGGGLPKRFYRVVAIP